MDVTIRNATADDAPFLARVMLTASRSHTSYGLWEKFVGGSEREVLAFIEKIAATKTPHLFHHEVFLIAEENGRASAGLSGYDPDTHGTRIYAQAIRDICGEIGWTGADLKEAFRRSIPYSACMPEETPGVWIVESVGCMPEARRRGLIDRLLRQILAKGKSLEYRQAQISVLLGNTPARRAYEKAGFRYVDEKRDPGFEAAYGDAGIARLMMDLT